MSQSAQQVSRGYALIGCEHINPEFTAGRLRDVTSLATLPASTIPVWSRSFVQSMTGGLGDVLAWANLSGGSITQQSSVISVRGVHASFLLSACVDEMLAQCALRLSLPFNNSYRDPQARAQAHSSVMVQSHTHAQFVELVAMAACSLKAGSMCRWIYRGAIGLMSSSDDDQKTMQRDFVQHIDQWFAKQLESIRWSAIEDLAEEPAHIVVSSVNHYAQPRSRDLI